MEKTYINIEIDKLRELKEILNIIDNNESTLDKIMKMGEIYTINNKEKIDLGTKLIIQMQEMIEEYQNAIEKISSIKNSQQIINLNEVEMLSDEKTRTRQNETNISRNIINKYIKDDNQYYNICLKDEIKKYKKIDLINIIDKSINDTEEKINNVYTPIFKNYKGINLITAIKIVNTIITNVIQNKLNKKALNELYLKLKTTSDIKYIRRTIININTQVNNVIPNNIYTIIMNLFKIQKELLNTNKDYLGKYKNENKDYMNTINKELYDLIEWNLLALTIYKYNKIGMEEIIILLKNIEAITIIYESLKNKRFQAEFAIINNKINIFRVLTESDINSENQKQLDYKKYISADIYWIDLALKRINIRINYKEKQIDKLDPEIIKEYFNKYVITNTAIEIIIEQLGQIMENKYKKLTEYLIKNIDLQQSKIIEELNHKTLQSIVEKIKTNKKLKSAAKFINSKDNKIKFIINVILYFIKYLKRILINIYNKNKITLFNNTQEEIILKNSTLDIEIKDQKKNDDNKIKVSSPNSLFPDNNNNKMLNRKRPKEKKENNNIDSENKKYIMETPTEKVDKLIKIFKEQSKIQDEITKGAAIKFMSTLINRCMNRGNINLEERVITNIIENNYDPKKIRQFEHSPNLCEYNMILRVMDIGKHKDDKKDSLNMIMKEYLNYRRKNC